jgi:hypothetical protein
MSLKTAVQAAGSELTDAEAAAWLAESAEASRDATAYTWAGLSLKLGVTAAAGVRALVTALKADATAGPMAELFDASLTSGGVNFASAEIRAALSAVRAGLPEQGQALIDAILNIGITYAPRYTLYGLDAPPTEAEVVAARAQLADEAAVAELFNEVLNPMQSDGSTVAEIKAAVAAWGA